MIPYPFEIKLDIVVHKHYEVRLKFLQACLHLKYEMKQSPVIYIEQKKRNIMYRYSDMYFYLPINSGIIPNSIKSLASHSCKYLSRSRFSSSIFE